MGLALNQTNAKSQFEQNMDHFGDEVEQIGKRIEESFEKNGQNIENYYEKTFNIICPLLPALIAFIIFFIIIRAFNKLKINNTSFISRNI
ncbi:MAG: hypothetical protein R6U21_06440 [Thermoplasmatota archaeon]